MTSTTRFVLSHPETPFLADLAMDFASILSAQYADAMLKTGTPEIIDLEPLGTVSFQLVSHQKDAQILYQSFQGYWGNKPKIDRLVFSITPIREKRLEVGKCYLLLNVQ